MSVGIDNISALVGKSVDSTKSKVHAVDGTCKAGMVGAKKIVELWKRTTTVVTASPTVVSVIFFLLVGQVETHDSSVRRRPTKHSKSMKLVQQFPFRSLPAWPSLQFEKSIARKLRAECNLSTSKFVGEYLIIPSADKLNYVRRRSSSRKFHILL
jgi:hypothetical protein